MASEFSRIAKAHRAQELDWIGHNHVYKNAVTCQPDGVWLATVDTDDPTYEHDPRILILVSEQLRYKNGAHYGIMSPAQIDAIHAWMHDLFDDPDAGTPQT